MTISGVSSATSSVVLQAMQKAQQQVQNSQEAIASGQKIDSDGDNDGSGGSLGSTIDEMA